MYGIIYLIDGENQITPPPPAFVMFKIYLDFSIPPTKPNVKINDDEYFIKKQ